MKYDREDELKNRLNSFLAKSFDIAHIDYYSKLNDEAILNLKSALSDINNILTYKVTIGLVQWIISNLNLDLETQTKLKNDVLQSKPSSNGYDLLLSSPIKLIAEVKCNIPVNNGSKYGAAQKLGIQKDIQGLLNGKSKSKVNHLDYLKFMAFLDIPTIREANTHMMKSKNTLKDSLVFIDDKQSFDKRLDVVYAIYIPLR